MKRWPEFSRRILDAVAGLVGELAEVDLVGVGRARQHADVGAGAEHAVLARAHHHDLHLRMLEAQPLHGVGQLDVDAEIVGIELELIALEQAAVLVDVHGQRRDVAVDRELPVPVARRIGLEIDVFRAAREHAIFTGHEPPLSCSGYLICTIMHVLQFSPALNARIMHFVSCSGSAAGSANGSGARPCAPSCSCNTAFAKSAIASSVASGASRCGEWPAPAMHRHIDRAIALLLRDLDLPHGAVLVVRALHDRDRHADIGEIFGDIPVAEFRIEPGAVPAIERVVDVLVPARELRLQVAWSRTPS